MYVFTRAVKGSTTSTARAAAVDHINTTVQLTTISFLYGFVDTLRVATGGICHSSIRNTDTKAMTAAPYLEVIMEYTFHFFIGSTGDDSTGIWAAGAGSRGLDHII